MTTLPTGNAAPTDLRGKWVDRDNDQVFLTLIGRTYRVDDGGAHVGGQISVRSRDLFAFSAPCGAVIGHYHWSVSNGQLRFAKLSDPCINRADVFARRVFRRSR